MKITYCTLTLAIIFALSACTNAPAEKKSPGAKGKPATATAIADKSAVTSEKTKDKKRVIKPATAKAVKLVTIDALSPRELDDIRTFSIQLAAYADGATAIKTANTLLRLNHAAIVTEADLGTRGTWYRVKLGVFFDRAEAEDLLLGIAADKNLETLVPHKGEFKPFVIENKGITPEFKRLWRIVHTSETPPPIAIFPSMNIWGKEYPAIFVSLEDKSFGLVELDNLNAIHLISTKIDWRQCRECRDISLDGPGKVTSVSPLGIANRLQTPLGIEAWVSVIIDSSAQMLQAYIIKNGLPAPIFEMPQKYFSSKSPLIKRKLFYRDLNGDGISEILIQETGFVTWERQLCEIWRTNFLYLFNDEMFFSLRLNNFDEMNRLKLSGEMQKMSGELLKNGYAEAAAAFTLDELNKEKDPVKIQKKALSFLEALKKQKRNMVAIRFLLLAAEIPVLGENSRKKLYKNTLDELAGSIRGARILHKPMCDESPIVRNFLPSEKGGEVIEKYLSATKGMIIPALFTGGDIARLGKAFKTAGKGNKKLKSAWLNILKQENANIYKLMKMSLEFSKDDDK